MKNNFSKHLCKEVSYFMLFSFEGLSRDEDYVLSYYIDCLSNENIKRDGDWMMLCEHGFVDNYLGISTKYLRSINKKLSDVGLIDYKKINGIGTYIKVNCDAIERFVEVNE